MTNFGFAGNSASFDVDFGEAFEIGGSGAGIEIDDTLSKPGAAADSGAVGDALDEIRETEDSRPSNLVTDDEGGATIALKSSENISIINKLKTVTERGIYSLFVQNGCVDNPPGAEGSLSGLAHIRLTEEDADCLHTWLMLVDQNGVIFTRNVSDNGDGEWTKGSGTGGGSGLPEFTEEDDGKFLMVSDGKVVASEVGLYAGDYVITPDADEEQLLETEGKFMADDILVKKIPYTEVTNPSDGITATIG